MIHKRNRIHSSEFSDYSKRGRVISSAHFSVRLIHSTPPPRFGVVVSKKIAKTAVLRNRLRRVLYHILRDLCEQTKGTHSIIVYVRQLPTTFSYTEWSNELREIFLKGGVEPI